MKIHGSNTITYLTVLFVTFLWGVNVVIIKVLLDYLPPLTMTAFRIFMAGIVVILILIYNRHLRNLTKREWKYTIMASVLGVVGHQILLTVGLLQTTAGNTAIILALVPLTTSILAIIFLNDHLTKLRFVGISFGLVGVCIVIFNGTEGVLGINIGDLYIFLSMLVQAMSFIYIKKATATLDSKQMTGIMLIVGSFILFILSLMVEPNGVSQFSNLNIFIWTIFIISAVFSTAIGHILYNSAIHKIGAGQTAVFNNFVPFFGVISSAIFLGERIVPSQILGFIFIVTGVLLGTGYIEEKFVERNQRRYQSM